jgi:hypothetical protein
MAMAAAGLSEATPSETAFFLGQFLSPSRVSASLGIVSRPVLFYAALCGASLSRSPRPRRPAIANFQSRKTFDAL